MAYSTEELGRLIARAHYQAWRTDAPPFDLTVEELAAILPNLIKSGSAGIVWHRVKPFREKYGAMAYALEAATDAQTAHNARVEEAVVEVVTRLRAYGIEPVLVKGLAMAKLYPEGIVRPAGDIDLVVRKEEFAAANAIIHDSSKLRIPIGVDLKHPGIWSESPGSTFWQRVQTIQVQAVVVSALGDVDNLAMIVFHFLKHDAQRPLSLCDYALVAESTPQSDAELLNIHEVGRSWIECIGDVSLHLLGCRSAAMESYAAAPDWLIREITSEWWRPRGVSRPAAIPRLIKNPHTLPEIMLDGWPSPIAACFRQVAPFTSRPSFAVGFKEYSRRIGQHFRLRFIDEIRSSL